MKMKVKFFLLTLFVYEFVCLFVVYLSQFFFINDPLRRIKRSDNFLFDLMFTRRSGKLNFLEISFTRS